MAKWVVKRGGKKEPFRKAKLERSIRLALRDAKVPAARAKKVFRKVARAALKVAATRTSVKASMLRTKVLGLLGKAEPSAARAWRKHESRRRARRRR